MIKNIISVILGCLMSFSSVFALNSSVKFSARVESVEYRLVALVNIKGEQGAQNSIETTKSMIIPQLNSNSSPNKLCFDVVGEPAIWEFDISVNFETVCHVKVFPKKDSRLIFQNVEIMHLSSDFACLIIKDDNLLMVKQNAPLVPRR